MILIQMTGLSGAGKSTIAHATQQRLIQQGYRVEILDGDVYRQQLCRDLGFSKADRMENINRLGFMGATLARHGVIAIIAAINPYEQARQQLKTLYPNIQTVHIDCPLEVLQERDPKGLYARASLPEGDPRRIHQFTGISDPYEPPFNPDLRIQTHCCDIETAVETLVQYVLKQITSPVGKPKALFIGRWQPFHNGHKWLIDNQLQLGKPVLIAVRDLPCDAQNPFSTEQTMNMIRHVYAGQPVEVIRLDDIESVNYGRGVGYAIQEWTPPTTIHQISATEIRQAIAVGNDDWKQKVPNCLHKTIQACLKS